MYSLSLTPFMTGCSTISPGPDRLFPISQEVAVLQQSLMLPDLSQPQSPDFIYSYITARMFAIDIAYSEYFANLTTERQLGTLGADFVSLGVGAATTVMPGAAVKSVLGAATTAIAGARTAIDKDIFIQQTIQILQNQMDASRLTIRTRILANLQKLSERKTIYTLAQGLSDLEDYYRAGTLAGALESLSATVGNDAQQRKNIENGTTQSGEVVNPTAPGTTAAGGTVRGFAAPAGNIHTGH